MPTPSVHAFAEKVAVITDGTNPIGRAVALQLALQGAFVITACGKKDEVESRALNELKSLGTIAETIETDISNVAGAEFLISETETMFGRIDFLINCLKIFTNSEFEETAEKNFIEVFDSNFKAAYFVTKEAMRLMKKRPKPKIVNLVSALDTDETSQNPLFASAQTALVGFTESLAKSLPPNFRTNAIAVSEKSDKAENEDAGLLRPKTAVPADDAARAILFLLSSESIGLNGQVIKVA